MSLDAFIAVACCPAIKGPARRAAIQIANAHNAKHGNAWPGLTLMAGREGVSTKTMETGVKQLEREGFVEVVRHRGKSNLYFLNLSKMQELKYVPELMRQRQNMISVANTSSAPTNPAPSTEPMFGRPRKTVAVQSVTNRINNHLAQSALRATAVHYGRSRKVWDRDLSYYRRRLNEGQERPFWHNDAGPRPTDQGCVAPIDLLRKYGFPEVAPIERGDNGLGRK